MENRYCISDIENQNGEVSPILCGNFVEFGYGLQVECMQSELLFNRSFEKFYSYKEINKDWFDLYVNPKNPQEGYETNWRKFDWWHNGYEHNAWFAAPLPNETEEIRDNSTFWISQTPYRNVIITNCEGGVHGESYLKVVNNENIFAGFAQRGKYVVANEQYDFTGYFQSIDNDVTVKIVLYPEGEWVCPCAQAELTIKKGDFCEYRAKLISSYSGKVVFSVLISPKSELNCDCFSLKNSNSYFGFKPEVIDAVKNQIQPKVIRWPGGCFASFYDWKDGIGKLNERKPTPSYFWGGLQSNDIGTLEMAAFCEAIGAESMMCINLYHKSKQRYDVNISPQHQALHGFDFPQFTDEQQGIQSACDWVAYCNCDQSHPIGSIRAKHGHEKPFGVKFFEFDNEPERWFTPVEYAETCAKYSIAMKKIDPTIKTGMVTYGEKIRDSIPKMLEIAGEYIDFIADRGCDEVNLTRKISFINDYNKKNNKSIKYCNTEWLPYDLQFFNVDSFNQIEGNKSYLFSKWRYAMNIFKQIMMWQRAGENVLFVNFNNLANTHSQNVIETPRDGLFITASGRAICFMSNSPAKYLLNIENYIPNLNDPIQVQAAWNEDRSKLILYVFNLLNEEQKFTFTHPFEEKAFNLSEWNILWAKSLESMNHQHDEQIHNDHFTIYDNFSKKIELSVPPHSFTQIQLSGDEGKCE